MAGVAVKGSLLVVLGLLLVAPMALGRPLEGVVNRINLQAADYIGIVVTSEKVLSELNNNFKPSDHIPEVELAGRKYHIGTLEGANVIIVNSGRHPVNVASAVQALIDNFPIRGIIDVGSAGSLNEKVLEIADVAVPEQVAFTGNWKWQQFEATGGDLTFGTYNVPKSGKNKLGSIVYQKTKFYTPRGTSPDVLYIPVTSNWLKIATNGLQGLELDKCLGTSSSNCLPTSPEIKFELKASASEVYLQNNAYRLFLRNEFGVSSVDETSAAVALASWSNGVEFVIFRGISNYAGGSGSNAAFSELAPVNAVKAVRAFIPLVNRARLAFEY